MGRILVGHGGAGSVATLNRLWWAGHACHHRPDIAFFPSDTPTLTTSRREGMQVLSADGYADRPTREAAQLFASRSAYYQLDLDRSIEENLISYVEHVIRSEAHTWLCRAPSFGFLTRVNLTAAVCVVRHPLHQYISFTQPYRHPDWAEAFGGRESEGAIRYFAKSWNAFTADCLDSGSRVIRYERIHEDSADDPFLRWLFGSIDPGKRSPGGLPPAKEALLCELTEPVWRRLYADWAEGVARTSACDT